MHNHQTTNQRLKLATLTFFLLLLIAACSGRVDPTPTTQPLPAPTNTPSDPATPVAAIDTDPNIRIVTNMSESSTQPTDQRLGIRLGAGNPEATSAETIPPTEGTPLSAETITQILSRLPDLIADLTDQVAFRLPPASLPRPRTGETIEVPFGQTDAPITDAPITDDPLEVLRYSPEGDVPLAPFISVTFNQPMVELGTIDQTLETIPVIVEPELPGTWRWLGTKTLRYDYSSDQIDRFPKSTDYTVTIPAGTTSANGNTLAEAVTFSFQTPRPQIVNFYPQNQAQPLEPLFYAEFDQRIDPAAVLETIAVTSNGNSYGLRIATTEEIAANTQIERMIERALDARGFAFKADRAFDPDSSINIQIGPNIPSAEGPLTSDETFTYSTFTYPPFQSEEHRCGWDDNCPPLSPFWITFNNQIDTSLLNDSMISIEPEIPNVVVNVFGNQLEIQGQTSGRTDYAVTISAELTDIFNQQLGSNEIFKFKVGSAAPLLYGNGENLVTVDPSLDTPIYTIYTINHDKLDLRIRSVSPAAWSDWQNWQQKRYDNNVPELPGTVVIEKSINIDSNPDELTETAIDLSEALEGDYGHLIIEVAEEGSLLDSLSELVGRERYREEIITWLQVTQIGIDAFADNSNLHVWTNALTDGKPLTDVSITTGLQSSVAYASDSEGMATIPLGNVPVLIAMQGDDSAILPRSNSYWDNEGWQSWEQTPNLLTHVFDDRQMYRPGETASIKGWVRRLDAGPQSQIQLVNNSDNRITYVVNGPQGNILAEGNTTLSAIGGFDFTIDIPENANLGNAWIDMQFAGENDLQNTFFGHGFQIQEFRRPEFEVTARNETSGPYLAGGHAVVGVTAAYFSGGPLPDADVTWNVRTSPGSYTPPGWNGFSFGKWVPWWAYGFGYDDEEFFDQFNEPVFESFVGKTDASGDHYLRIDFDDTPIAQPVSISAESQVEDVNRQVWAASTNLLVHPSELYVGMRSDRYFVRKGTPLDIEAIAVDIDGNAVADAEIVIRAARLEWRYTNNWTEEEVDVQECVVVSAETAVECSFPTDSGGGTWRISASVLDSAGRKNESSMTRWVSGGKQRPNRNVELEQATLIPDREEYAPGDSAEILVQSPFLPAEGLMTVSHGGILYTERFTIDGDSTILTVPITDEMLPNANVKIDLVGAAVRTTDNGTELPDLPARPAYATGQLDLRVSLASRTLAISLDPAPARLEPGGSTTLAVNVQNADGSAAADAEIAVVVVDEAILALSNYQLADPLTSFYQQRWPEIQSSYARASIVLANPENLTVETESEGESLLQKAVGRTGSGGDEAMMDMAVAEESSEEMAPMAMSANMADDDGASTSNQPIAVRTNFDPLAIFAPAVTTDADGNAVVEIDLPDNLTRYRVMAVAVGAENLFGSAESNITARLPLMVRPSAPRFLNFGDVFELPVVIQNQTDEPMEVDVVVETTNLLITDNGLRVTVPANDRVELRFPATTLSAGTAQMQFAAVSGDFADAATIDIPVYTPATTEAFATYGVVDSGATVQPLAAIEGVYPQFGGLEIGTSSTALQALTDAVLYLHEYHYQSSEALASRILAVAALRDVLDAFEADGLPDSAELEEAITRDLEILANMQNNDGGFPWWQRSRDSIPFNTIHVAHALQRAADEGFNVPGSMRENAANYLRNIEDFYPHYYGPYTRANLTAYALYVRHLSGESVSADADSHYASQKSLLTLDSQAWIWNIIGEDGANSAEIRDNFANRVVETAGSAQFLTDFNEESYLTLQTNRRTDAIVLDALISNQPDSDLIPKLVNSLLGGKTKGRWDNTQENVFVLLALNSYFDKFESQTPDFVARIWLGEDYAGEHVYEGRSTDRNATNIPMDYLIENGADDIVLSKEGEGRLYYRLGLTYAPDDLRLEARDAGFVLERIYEAIDDPADVTRDEDGTWRIKAGAQVRVRLTLVAESQRTHVALVDPLPAGLEIVNPNLSVSAQAPADPNDPSRQSWWWWTWYDHQNARDDRAEAFATWMYGGVYDYSYVTRATTPGTFVAPPTRAEMMYEPEVFGRTSTDIVIIED